jgi:membrane fusion protein, multidrug efflux system
MKAMKDDRTGRRTFAAGWTLAPVAVAATLGLSACKKEGAAPLPAPIVQVAAVVATNVPMSIEIIGQLDSPQNVEVRARVEGFVDKVLFTEGTEVQEGAPLFLLDKKPFEERSAAAKGVLAEAIAQLNKYKKDVARLQPLAQKRAIPQQDLDNALASVEVGNASVVSARAQVESAQLGYCEVHAPISGLIGAKQVSIGELVGKGQPTLLATMSTLDPIWFYCAISEVQYLKAQAEVQRRNKQIAELPVSLILANGAVHPDQGRFVFIDRAIDVKTGTLRIRAEFSNKQKLLRPGMFGRIKVDLGVRPDTILVPERAIAELQGKNFVWVIDSANKATQRAVKVGESINGHTQIHEGLKPGERVVMEGLQKVREGALVKALTAQEMAQATQETEAKPAKD